MNTPPDRLFKALSDESRLRVLKLLAGGELCVCDLVAALAMGQSKISRHVSYLKRSGLVTLREDGKWSYYALAKPKNGLHARLLALIRGLPPFERDAARLRRGERRCA